MYSCLGEHNKAKELHEQALMIYKKSFGEEHAAVARIYSNLASVYNCLGQYNQAKELHEKALMIREKIVGDHADVAASYNNLALFHKRLEAYNRAKELLELLENSLTIVERNQVDILAWAPPAI